MSPPSHPVLQQLPPLDKSSSRFHDQLSDILHKEEFKICVPGLQDDDLMWLVEYLDKALSVLDPSSTAFQRSLHRLKSICGARKILPTSCVLSTGRVGVPDRPLARGGYGDVYKGTLDGSEACVKVMRVYIKEGPEKVEKAFCEEAAIWKHTKHPNILPLLGTTIKPFQLVSDWMSGGELLEYIKRYTDADLLGLLFDIAKGLCYLHSHSVIHGDLKGPNILVDNRTHRACIADFGLARVTRSLDSVYSMEYQSACSPRWTAPEVLEGGSYSVEADVFSFAMVIVEIFTGAPPFCDNITTTVILAIVKEVRPKRPPDQMLTDDLWMLTQRCWSHEPHLRPKISEVLRDLIPELPAWKQLIHPATPMDKRISLTNSVFSDHDQVEMVKHLSGDSAQNFIGIIDEVTDNLEPQVRKNCSRAVSMIRNIGALLPPLPPIQPATVDQPNAAVDGFVSLSRRGKNEPRGPPSHHPHDETGRRDEALQHGNHPMPVPKPLTNTPPVKDGHPSVRNEYPPKTMSAPNSEPPNQLPENSKGGLLKTMFSWCC